MVKLKGGHFVVLFNVLLICFISSLNCLDWLPFSPEKLNSTEFSLISNENQCFANVDSSLASFRVDLHLDTYSIPCNETLFEEVWNYDPLEASEISCEYPDQVDHSCHKDNTVSIVFCFVSLFEQKNSFVRPQLYLTNFNNNVTKICNNHRNEGADPEKHGIGASICVEKLKGEHVVHTHIQLSYAEKSYSLPSMKYSHNNKQSKSKKVPFFSFMFGLKNGSMTTQMLDFNGMVVNLNEKISLNRNLPYAPGALLNLVKDNPLAFAFLNMKSFTVENDTIVVRPFSLHYNDRIDSQIQVLINGKEQITLNGIYNNDKELERKLKRSCEFRYPEQCTILKEYKKQICAQIKKCLLNKPPPPKGIRDRWEVPERLKLNNKNKSEKSAGFAFCDNPDNLMIDDTIEITPENADAELAKAKACYANQMRRSVRQINFPERRWKIPIEFTFQDPDLPKLKNKLFKAIRKGLRNIEAETCIRFLYARDTNTNADHMEFIYNRRSCFVPYVLGAGKDQAIKQINLDTELMGTAVHEIGHALGLDHEFERSDREEYIWCMQAKNTEYDDNYGLPYDFSSAMQYQSSIVDRGTQYYNFIPYERAYQDSLGPDIDSGLSFKDAKLLNKFYCEDKCNESSILNCKNGGYQDPNDCTKCRCPRGYTGQLCAQLETNDPMICSSSLSEETFDIVPAKGITKLTGKIIGEGSCFWRIQTFASNGNPVMLKEIVVKEVNGLKCPMRNDDLDECGSNAWIYPCINYLRVQYGKDKTESGARLCCQDSLPLTLTSKTLKYGFADVLLELKNSEENEVSFTLEFSIEPITLQNSCGCGPPIALLFKPERNPGTTGHPSKEPTKCNNVGVMSSALACSFTKKEAKTVKIKINGNELSKNELVDFTNVQLHAGNDFAYGFHIICLTTTNNDTLPFWAWNKGNEEQPLRIDEFQCY